MDLFEQDFARFFRFLFDRCTHDMMRIVFVIIIFLGIVGNVLNIIVFAQKNMRKSFTFKLLLCLSLIDLVILIMCALETVTEFIFEVDIRLLSGFFCKLDTFLAYFLLQSRNVFSMSITIERTIIISNFRSRKLPKCSKTGGNSKSDVPLNNSDIIELNTLNYNEVTIVQEPYARKFSKHMLSYSSSMVKKFKNILLVTLVLLLVINMHFLMFLNVHLNLNKFTSANKYPRNGNSFHEHVLEDNYRFLNETHFVSYNNQTMHSLKNLSLVEIVGLSECSARKNTVYWYFLHFVWFWLDMIVYFVVPFLTMTISFILIFIKVRKSNRNYRGYLITENRKYNNRIYLKKIKKNQRIIVKLFVVNLYFFLSIFPYFLFNIFVKNVSVNRHSLAENLVSILFYSNNALNFFFYGVTSQKFLKEFVKMYQKYRGKI